MKNEKGITLIALIITIIIMLILVAVTVNVAINGGLFTEANKAATGTEKEAIYDQIVSAMVLDDNGKINVKKTYDAVSGMLTITETNPLEVTQETTEVEITVQGKKGTYKYTITGEEILNPEDTNSGESEITTVYAEDPDVSEAPVYVVLVTKNGIITKCAFGAVYDDSCVWGGTFELQSVEAMYLSEPYTHVEESGVEYYTMETGTQYVVLPSVGLPLFLCEGKVYVGICECFPTDKYTLEELQALPLDE